MTLSLGCSGCAHDVTVTVAPHLGETVDCLPWQSPDAAAKAWVSKHASDRPKSFDQWAAWLERDVKPHLAKECS
jgi:hypothetical protein